MYAHGYFKDAHSVRKKIEERRLQPIQGLRSTLAEDSGPVAGSVSGRELR